MKDTAITLAVIRVEATYPDGPEVTLHAKALYLLPDAEERFTILLPPDTDQQSVQLQTVRGMPADDAGKIRRWFDFF